MEILYVSWESGSENGVEGKTCYETIAGRLGDGL